MRNLKNKYVFMIMGGLVGLSILACGGDGPEEPTEPTAEEFCGGIAGIQCENPDDVCIPADNQCFVADGSGTCQPRPELCTREYAPVCGCDGKTYSNRCNAVGAGVGVEHEGECAAPPVGQVCGTRGAAACPSGQVCIHPIGAICGHADAPGTCQVTPQACPEIYDPVCGCDGRTYDNECAANRHGISAKTRGACAGTPVTGQTCGTRGAGPCPSGQVCIHPASANCGRADLPGTCQVTPQACTQQYDPVCGCDGRTYSNACMANQHGISVDTLGPCGNPTTH